MNEPTKQKILIVEDDKAISTALSHIMQRENFEVLTGQDGQEGLEIAIAQHPDLILLDMIMPKLSGHEVLKELRKDEWGKNVPVIVLSNSDQPATIAETMESGVSHYMLKADVKTDELLSTIRSMINK